MAERDRPRTGGEIAWHALSEAEVEARVESRPRGLTQAEVDARLARFGPNQLEEAPPTSALEIFLRQFKSPLIYILLLAALATLVLGKYVDAAVIGVAVALNAVIGFTQERKADVSVRALMRLVSPRARVLRDGKEVDVESRALVPGDIVLLESGVRVPADVRLTSTSALAIDESLFTGESTPVTKLPAQLDEGLGLADRINLAYTGTIVTSGRGRGYVIATGSRTELGAIAGELREEERTSTHCRSGWFACCGAAARSWR